MRCGLKLDEELQLLLGRVFISGRRLKWLPRPSPSSVGLQKCCLVVPPPPLTYKRNEFLELLLGVSFEKWGIANGKMQHFPFTTPLCFELKCIQAPERKRSAFDAVVLVLAFHLT